MDFYDYLQVKNKVLKIQASNDKILSIAETNSKRSPNPNTLIKKVKSNLDNYLQTGIIQNSSLYNLCDINILTPFQKKLSQVIIQIPPGETMTYKNLSITMENSPHYARAIGQALNKNPFLLIIPCQRITSSSDLGGYVLGQEVKKYLLNIENHIQS